MIKVSILTPDLSHNCLGRAYLLAKILKKHYEVEVVGPLFDGDCIWKPVVNDESISYKFVRCSKLNPYWQIRQLIKKINGDVIYAHKPSFMSFGVGLLKKVFEKKPLILDIDDWQMGFMKESWNKSSSFHRFIFLIFSTLFFYNLGSYWNSLFGEKLARCANEITVSNNFLQKKFGGTIVWHARDIKVFDPGKFDQDQIKEKYKIDRNRKVVMFFGTPRPYKGIEHLMRSIKLVKNKNILLVIIGIDNEDSYCFDLVKTAKKSLGKRFIGLGQQSFEMAPELLAMADIVVIPQKKNFATIGQIPAKIFDAMAMAKPIIATNVSDLPEILDGCGWIIESGNEKQLVKTIQYILDNPGEAKKAGEKARQKCLDYYSLDIVEKVLVNVFRRFEK